MNENEELEVNNNGEETNEVNTTPDLEENEVSSTPDPEINEVSTEEPKYSPLMEPEKNNSKKGLLYFACIGAVAILAICICIILLRDRGANKGNGKDDLITSENNTDSSNTDTSGSESSEEVTEEVTYPPVDVILGDYKGLSVAVLPVEVSDEDVQSELDYLISSTPVIEPITDRDEVVSGDVVNIDYVGSVDGVEFQGGSDQNFDLEIGSGAFIPGFEDQIIGHKVSEEFDITVTFPESYQADLAGKEAVFHITLHSIGKYVEAEATDEFIAANTEYATLAEYKDGIYNELLQSAQEASDSQKQMDLVTMAIENATFNNLSEEEVKAKEADMRSYYETYASYSGMDLATFALYYFGMDEDTFNTEIAKAAETQVKQNYLLDKIIEVEELSITELEYTEGLSEYAAQYGFETPEAFESSYGKDSIETSLLYDKALDLILTSAVIVTD